MIKKNKLKQNNNRDKLVKMVKSVIGLNQTYQNTN